MVAATCSKKEHGLMSLDVKVLSAVYWHVILSWSILCLDRRLVGVVPLLLLADRSKPTIMPVSWRKSEGGRPMCSPADRQERRDSVECRGGRKLAELTMSPLEGEESFSQVLPS